MECGTPFVPVCGKMIVVYRCNTAAKDCISLYCPIYIYTVLTEY